MSLEPTARQVHHVDQTRALLRQLVEAKRAHDRSGCSFPDMCVGRPALDTIEVTSPHTVGDLLAIAVVDLAASNYHANQEGPSTS